MTISVCIVSYNQSQYLVEAIESVLNQTLQPFELIIVDDASTDDSRDVIAAYAARQPGLIRPHYHAQNQGVARTRNAALAMVRGDYVTFLDSDDHFLPDKLEKEAAVLKSQPGTHLVFSNYFITDEHGHRQSVWVKPGERPPEGDIFPQVFARDLPGSNWFRSELVDFKLWRHVGFFDPRLTIYEDYDMRIRLAHRATAAYCDASLSDYRQHAQGLSRAHPPEHLTAFEYIFDKNRHLLDTLPPDERTHMQSRLRGLLAERARKAARWEMQNGARRAALAYGLRALRYRVDRGNIRLLLDLLTP